MSKKVKLIRDLIIFFCILFLIIMVVDFFTVKKYLKEDELVKKWPYTIGEIISTYRRKSGNFGKLKFKIKDKIFFEEIRAESYELGKSYRVYYNTKNNRDYFVCPYYPSLESPLIEIDTAVIIAKKKKRFTFFKDSFLKYQFKDDLGKIIEGTFSPDDRYHFKVGDMLKVRYSIFDSRCHAIYIDSVVYKK